MPAKAMGSSPTLSKAEAVPIAARARKPAAVGAARPSAMNGRLSGFIIGRKRHGLDSGVSGCLRESFV
jgi:hypothetical protein